MIIRQFWIVGTENAGTPKFFLMILANNSVQISGRRYKDQKSGVIIDSTLRLHNYHSQDAVGFRVTLAFPPSFDPWSPLGAPWELLGSSHSILHCSKVQQLLQLWPSARLVALGGATEVTVWSNFFQLRAVDPAWRSVPYGRPIWNHQQLGTGKARNF